MAPFEAIHEDLNQIFEKAQQLQKELKKKQLDNSRYAELSMGMSRDYTDASAYGSTYVRIGTAFFK